MVKNEQDLEAFFAYVRHNKGLDLCCYRSTFVARRLKKRMNQYKVEHIAEYITILKHQPQEWDRFFESLSINVSEFFRDFRVFDFFHHYCLRKLFQQKAQEQKNSIKVWSAGCSFGEEAYSLAILLKECAAARKDDVFSYRVWATDVDRHALSVAKKGEFENSSIKNIHHSLLRKYFTSSRPGVWQINEDVQKAVIFRQHNLFTEPPIKFVDIIFCRNVRIYFNRIQAEKVLWNLYGALNPGGYLVLGEAEALPVSLVKKFTRVERSCKIFQKIDIKGR